MHKTVLSEGQQLLDIEIKKRFDEPWSTKNIVEQGDALHATIWAQISINLYIALVCGSMFHVYCHNMKITMEKRKTKKIKANNSDLHLIKPPWVYKHMLDFLPIL